MHEYDVLRVVPAESAGDTSRSRLDELERRLRAVEEELEESGAELIRLREERDFYTKLLGEPSRRDKR